MATKRRNAGPGTSRGALALAEHAKKVKESARAIGAESVEEEFAELETRSRALARKLKAYGK